MREDPTLTLAAFGAALALLAYSLLMMSGYATVARRWLSDHGPDEDGDCEVARRKPKPVTRDVLAWDLEPGMKLADGRTVQFTTRMLDSGKRLVEVACVGDRDHSVLIHDQTAAVLVEEPNG